MTEQNFRNLSTRLSTGIVQVRWLALDTIAAGAWDGLAALLDDAERVRSERFHFERDRQAYVAAHALVRLMLSAQVPRPPAAWRFSANDHGKPEVMRDVRMPILRFNLSHTRGLVAVGLTLENDIGIDVEAIEPTRLSLALAERTFAPAEVAMLRETRPEDLSHALFAIWTLKEAVIKAMGQGLAIPLQGFALTLDPLSVQFSDAFAEDPANWLLWRQRPTSLHTLALALRHIDPAAVGVDASAVDASDLLALAERFR